MPAAPHRQTPNRAREFRERVWAAIGRRLGDKTICGRCGATFRTMDDRCTSDLGQACPGSEAVAAARAMAVQEVRAV